MSFGYVGAGLGGWCGCAPRGWVAAPGPPEVGFGCPAFVCHRHADLKPAKRVQLQQLTKKYWLGMQAASKKSGRQYSHDAFIRGELDIPVSNSVNPAVVGPYWDWVKAADKAAEEAAASEVVAAMEEQIQKAMEELQNEAARADEHKASCEQDRQKERDDRLRGLYQVKLEAYNHKISQLLPPLYEQATEICIKREERVAAEKLRLNGKYFLLVDKEMMASPAWVRASENNEVLVIIDAALGVQVNDDNLTLGFSLAGSTGVVLTLLPSDHAALMAAELVITEACRQGRHFFRLYLATADGHGWAVAMCSSLALDVSALVKRMLCSKAVKAGAIMAMPSCPKEEIIKLRNSPVQRHNALAQQRGKGWYHALFDGLDVFGPGSGGVTVVELDGGVAEIAHIILERVLAGHGGNELDVLEVPLLWAGGLLNVCKNRKNILEIEVQKLLDRINNVVSKRRLKRNASTTSDDLNELVQRIPEMPVPDDRIAPRRGPGCSDDLVPCRPMSLGCGVDIRELSFPCTPLPTKDGAIQVPAALCLLKQCLASGVVVAPSLAIPKMLGLYSAKPFTKGDQIVCGTSAAGRWLTHAEATKEKPIDNRYTIEERCISSIRAETTMYLCGDPCLDVWANMNSSAVPPSAEARLVKAWGGLVHETWRMGQCSSMFPSS